MRRVSILVLSGALALTHVCPARPAPPLPTPEIKVIAALDIKGMVAYAMRGALGHSGEYVGLAVLCAMHGPAEIKATAFFGAFPGAHRPVQLAVRSPDGAVERFGAVLAGGPEAGFHSPQLRDPHDAQRFVTVALQPGALISNGYRSFWNRASEQRNQQVRDEFLACVHRPAPPPPKGGPSMTKEKWLMLTGGLLALGVLCFAWSTALTLLLGRSLNSMEPWAVVAFMAEYGFSGSAGSLLFRSFLMAFAAAGVLAAAFLLINPPAWYGDARWATAMEIGRARLQKKRGLLLGKKGRKYLINDEPLHTLVAAPTRSGKGVGIVIPNLLTWNGSVVVLDIKKENYQLTAGYRSKHQEVFLWSPMDERTACYNPLDFVATKGPNRITDIQKLAQILLPRPEHGEKMWVNEAQSLFLGVALLVLDDPEMPSTLGQVYRILMADARLNKIAEEALDNPELDTACHEALANYKNKAEKERSGVKSSLTSALALWANPNIDAATSRSDFDLRDFRSTRSSVYVGVGQDQLLTLAPLLNMFFQQAVAELSKSLPDENEPHEVLFLIDEFPMLGAMPTLQKGLALLAGYKIRIVLITQGLGQLDEIYGRQATEGILQNCALQVFFASNDDTTTNYVSSRLGSKTVQVKSRSQSQDWTSGSTSTSYIARPLLPPEEVRRLNPKKAIIFKETSRPILAEKVRYYEDRRLTKLLLDPPAVPPLPARGRSASEAERQALEDAGGQPEEIGGLLAPHHTLEPPQDKAAQAGEPQPA